MQISRHINHTGRRKIKHSEVEIQLVERESGPPGFTVDLKLDRSRLPPDADVFVEAYHRNTSQRFSFGTVAAPAIPEDTTLDQIDLSGPTLFRVKVVDNSDRIGRLIAAAEKMSPRDDDAEEQRSSLMIFKSMPEMGNLVWKLSFNEAHKPVLCINNRIPEAKNQLLHNPFFQALILPAAFRETLLFVLWDQGVEADDGSWQQQWLDFAARVAQEEPPLEEDPDLLHGWVDDVIRSFSEKHHFCELLVKRMEDKNYG